MGFSRQEYWSGLPFPPLGDLPDPGSEIASLVAPVSGRFFTTEPPGKPPDMVIMSVFSDTAYFPKKSIDLANFDLLLFCHKLSFDLLKPFILH